MIQWLTTPEINENYQTVQCSNEAGEHDNAQREDEAPDEENQHITAASSCECKFYQSMN